MNQLSTLLGFILLVLSSSLFAANQISGVSNAIAAKPAVAVPPNPKRSLTTKDTTQNRNPEKQKVKVKKKNDKFLPTEKISQDLSVSFPIDI